MPTENVSTYLDKNRTEELWTAITTKLAGKADLSALDGYTTPDAVATAITAALTNYATNASVQTAIATALANYMTTSEVNDAIAKAVTEAAHITFQVVDALPDTGQPNVIYLVPSVDVDANNVKTEYMWINNAWEIIGTTTADLSDYWSKDELRVMTSEELQAILV